MLIGCGLGVCSLLSLAGRQIKSMSKASGFPLFSSPLLTSLSPRFSSPSPLLLSPVGGSRNSEHVVIKVEKRGAIVMPSLKSSVAVFHVTNALQSRVVASLLGLFFLPPL